MQVKQKRKGFFKAVHGAAGKLVKKITSLKRYLVPKKLKGFFLAVFFVLKRVLPVLKHTLLVLKTIVLPLLAGAVVFFVLRSTGLVMPIAEEIIPKIGFIPALIIMILVSFIPVVSPLLGPSLFITFLIAVLTGERIAAGVITPFMVLPALIAIDVHIGNKIIPPSYALGETAPETINAGVPGIFYTRLITIPAAVAAVYVFNFVLQ